MHYIYRVTCSHSSDIRSAISEIACTSGKHLLFVAFLATPCLVEALPTGGELTAGQAVISSPDANTLQIHQSSPKAVVNWQGFSIAGHEAVNINQPDASAAILNRVVGQDVSQIQGKLNANGQVYLINPNGVMFSKTAQIDVGGLIATTHDIKNDDFMNGKNHFSQNSATGKVENHGTINTTDGGVVALIGEQVTNTGTIDTPKGTTALVAGKTVDLDMKGNGLVEVKVSEAALNAQITNQGAIKADGGRVVLTAKAASDLMNTVINNEGIIQAQSLVERNGQIYLDGGDTGVTKVSGTLDASGNSANNTGGQIVVTGDKVRIDSTAKLDATGHTGGGEILVGGSWQNSNPAIRQAATTAVQKGALLDASATDNGKGGTIVAWSNVQNQNSATQAQGTFLAKGGANGGDGGRIETSGHWLATDAITVNTSATQGNAGAWLLDPSDVTISAGPVSGDPLPPFFPFGTSTFFPTQDSVVLASTISNALSNNSTVIITTQNAAIGNGDINVLAPILKSGGFLNRLELQAFRNINVNSDISSTSGSLDVRLTSDTGSITLGANIATNGGYLAIDMLSTGNVTATNSALDVANLQLNSPGQAVNWTLDNPNNTIGTVAANIGTGNLLLKNNQSLSVGSVTSISGTVNGITSTGSNITLEAATDLTLNQAVTTNNALITLAAGGNFINNLPLDTGIVPTGTARYLVYSLDPATTLEGMSTYNKHYNQSYTSGVIPAYATTGNWFLYSIAPNITITPGSQTQVYGSALAPITGTMAGFIDGDTSATPGAIDNPAALSFNIIGIPSSSGNVTAGLHDVAAFPFLLSSSLGYSFSNDLLSTNEVNITPKTLTITGATGVNKTFDSTTTASVAGTPTLNGLIASDVMVVSPTATGNFADANVGTAKPITVNATGAGGFQLTGVDATNYTLTQPAGLSANINPAPVVIIPPVPPVPVVTPIPIVIIPTVPVSDLVPSVTTATSTISPPVLPTVITTPLIPGGYTETISTLAKLTSTDLELMGFSGLTLPVSLDKLFEVKQDGLNIPSIQWSILSNDSQSKPGSTPSTDNVKGYAAMDMSYIFKGIDFKKMQEEAKKKTEEDAKKTNSKLSGESSDNTQNNNPPGAVWGESKTSAEENKQLGREIDAENSNNKNNKNESTSKKDDLSRKTKPKKTEDDLSRKTKPKKTEDDLSRKTKPKKTEDDLSRKTKPKKTETPVEELVRLKDEEKRIRDEKYLQELLENKADEKKAKEDAETAKKKAEADKYLAAEKVFLAQQKGKEELKKAKEAAKKAKEAAKSTKLLAAEKDNNTKDLDTAIDFGKRVRKAADEAAQAAVDAKKAADAAQKAVKDGGSKDDAKAAAKAATQAAKDAAAAAKDADEVMKKVNEMRSQADAVYATENEKSAPNRKTCGTDPACQDKVLKALSSKIDGSDGLTKLGSDPDEYSKMILKLFLEGRLTLEELKAECSATSGCNASLVTEDLVKKLRKAAQDAQDAEIVAREERVKKEFEASLAKVKENRVKKEAEDYKKTCQSDPACGNSIKSDISSFFGIPASGAPFWNKLYDELIEKFLRGEEITPEMLNEKLEGFDLKYSQSSVDKLMSIMRNKMMVYKDDKEKADKKAAKEKALAEKLGLGKLTQEEFNKILTKVEPRSDKKTCSAKCKEKILYYGGWSDKALFTKSTKEGKLKIKQQGVNDGGTASNPMFKIYDLFFNNTLTYENVVRLAYVSDGLIDPMKITPEYVQDIKDRLEAAFLLHADGQ